MENLALKVDGAKLAHDAQRLHDPKPPQRPKPFTIPITTVDEARQWSLWVESQVPSPLDNLRNCDEGIADLTNRIDLAEEVLKTATCGERRTLCGYDEKARPSLPGIADSYIHVPGTIERLKDRRAELERVRPLIERKAEKFKAVLKALEGWPHHRIARIRNSELERRWIVRGVPVQRRGVL